MSQKGIVMGILMGLFLYCPLHGQVSFSNPIVIQQTETDGASCVYAADLDGDLDWDVLSASYEDDKIAWYRNGLISLQCTISGYVRELNGTGIENVVMNGLPNNPITDANGFYTARVAYGWSGRVTPSKEGYVFTPSFTIYTNVTSHQTTDYIGVYPGSEVEEISHVIPREYFLSQNYPNPFNPETGIQFGLVGKSKVSLWVYNVCGEVVDCLMEGKSLGPGVYEVRWRAEARGGESLPGGVYFVRILAEREDGTGQVFSKVRKMVLVK